MIVDLGEAMEFVQLHFVSMLFSILFILFILLLLRMNSSNGRYDKFLLAHLIMREDGKLDRRGFRETVLFVISIYGFLFVIQKHPTMLVEYFLTMAGVWLGAHIAADKLPTLGGKPLPVVPVVPPVEKGHV